MPDWPERLAKNIFPNQEEKSKEPKITKARIGELVRVVQMPAVHVIVEGSETEQKLFEFYPDEITFKAEEFIGLTVEQAYELRKKKDTEWLMSDSYEPVR